MNRSTHLLLLLCFGVSLFFLFTACAGEGIIPVEEVIIERTNDIAAEPGLMHVVHFWLVDGLTDAEEKSFLKGVRTLEGIPTVKRMFLGPPASTTARDVVDHSFDYALIAYFDDIEGHDVYQTHPIHLKFVEEHAAKFKTVQVRDNTLAAR